mmetsp:Transcript_17368/g.15283  ORF Transcript_17368/g.15283 Transcript_17368/m.15283 type:complete len:98 (+) Transcript_17368:316-609(+)
MSQKMMMIGARGTGRHTLLDLVFDGESSKNSNNDIRNVTDLIMKTRKSGNTETRYKFWIQDPCEKKIETLYRVYYKSIESYIFVFRLNQKDTLTDLA